MAGGANIDYLGPPIANDRAVVTLDEVQSGENKAPEGTEPYVVRQGDTLYEIARDNGYGNPPDMDAFYADNPQYAESERNPDLIWPGEVVFVRTPEGQAPDANGDGEPDPATDTDGDGVPDPVSADQAAATTDTAAERLEQAEQAYAEYMQVPGGNKGLRGEYEDMIAQARTDLRNALQAEIEFGLEAFLEANPDATPEEIRTEAERLANQAQGRTGTATEMPDSTVDTIVQNAINNVSAEQQGIDLDRVAPGTTVNDGPYTETSGPFEPNSTITLRDGSKVTIDEHGYPNPGNGEQALRPNPESVEQAQTNVGEAVDDVVEAQNIPNTGPEAADKQEILAARHTALGNAIQREIELRLIEWLEANPAATDEEVAAQALAIGEEIQQREGDAVPTSTVEYRAEAAANAVNSSRG